MKSNLVRITYYDKEKHQTEGFKSITFYCINQTIPATSPVTVTYQCIDSKDAPVYITVPLVHSIESV